MRVAVISDIHSNFKAFEAFLEYIEAHPVDAIIGLGDYVTDMPYPRRTLDMLYGLMEKYPCTILRGNREEYLLNHRKQDQGWHISSPSGALLYTYENITDRDLDFFEGLPTVMHKVQLGDCPELTLCHGAPEEVRGNLKYDLALQNQVMKELSTQYLLGGHTHHQETISLYDKLYINPGSLGLAIDEKGGHADFAILVGNKEGWEYELVSIPYDLEGMLQTFAESGVDAYGLVLNRAVKKTMETGINWFYFAAMDAMKLSGKPLHQVEEDVWDQVAEKLEL